MKGWLCCAFAVVLGVALPAPPPNQTFSPVWKVGDVFWVEYRAMTFAGRAEPGGPFRGEDWVYAVRHEVVKKEKTKEGKTRTILQAVHHITHRTKDIYNLVFEEKPLVLREVFVGELGPGPHSFEETNDFGEESVMFGWSRVAGLIGHFPKIPDTNQDEERVIPYLEEPGGANDFTQRLTFADGKLKVSMAREDNGKTMCTQTWEPGKKWWSEAEETKDGEFRLKGRLLKGKEAEEAAQREKEAEEESRKEREAEEREEKEGSKP